MALREILARFAFKVDPRGIKQADKGIAGVVGKLKGLGVALGAGVVARGVKDFVTGMVDAGDALGKTATQLGLGSNELQAWQAAAGFAGVENEKFNQSLRVLAKNANQAAQGSKGMVDKFDQLGVSVTDTNGNLKSSDSLMRDVGLELGKLENKTEAVAIAQELMGRSGAALLPLFKDGEKGLNSALAAVERFGGGLSKELIPLAEQAQDRFAEWDIAMLSLKSRVAVAILPALNSLVLSLSKMAAAASKFLGNGEALKAVLIAIGLALGKMAIARFGSQLLSLGRAAIVPLLKLALLVLIIDDLLTFFKGGDSLIGRALDKIFGKGAANKTLKALKEIGKGIKALISDGDWDALDKALENTFGAFGADIVGDVVFTFKMIGEVIDAAFQGIADSLNAFFQGIADWVNNVLDGMANGVKSFTKAAADLGRAIIDGISEAITDGADAVVEALGDVVQAAVDAAKEALGIDSPSKVFKDIGKQNIEGLVAGMQGAAGKAIRAAGTVTANVAVAGSEGAASGLNRGGGVATAAGRGGLRGRGGGPMAIFKSEVHLTVNGGSASDPQIQKLRQGVRSELRDNRRATLAALEQVAEVG